MSKKHIITMSGDLASGKGTVAKILSESLGYEIYKNGEYARMLARNLGLDITSFNVYVADHPEIDQEIENSAAKYAETHDNLVVDARLGWYAIPDSFKVYLTVDIDVAAQRAFLDPNRKSTETFQTVQDQKADMQNRFRLENERFFKLYGIRKEDLSNYDLVIDTTNKTPLQVATEIVDKYNAWLEE